ncbi:hypothetical protein [Dysgonomonas mossii]|uniref:hypothetical protein n=1 Tax=Dysgonomonas mossii TaxID=163665 RepID=UPI003993A6D6
MKGIITFIVFCLVLTGGSAIPFFVPMLALILIEEGGVTTATNPLELEWYWIAAIIIYFILSLKLMYKASKLVTNKIFEFLKID